MEYCEVKIPQAIIGRFGKEYDNLVLRFNQETVYILDDKGHQIVEPFLWKDVTGASLSYTPLKLQNLVLEVKTKRVRETNKRIIEEPYISLYYASEHIPLIEKTLTAKGLDSKIKEGISDILVIQPFSYLYHSSLRRALSYLSKITRPIITLCFLYTILKYMTPCTSHTEDCIMELDNVIHFISDWSDYSYAFILGLFHGSLLEIFIGLLLIWPLLPFAFTFLAGAVVLYLAEFVVHSAILLIVFNSMTMVVQEYKSLKALVAFFSKYYEKSLENSEKNMEKGSGE